MTTATRVRALEAPIDGWLDELRRGRRLSPRTVDAYARDLADYTEFAHRHKLGSWEEATLTFVDGYFASLQRRDLSSATVTRRRSTLRGFHGFLARVGHKSDDPIALLPAPRRERKLPHALTLGDIEALLGYKYALASGYTSSLFISIEPDGQLKVLGVMDKAVH